MREKACTAVIVAAGSASRMRGIDKTVAPIGGVPMILRTVRALAASDRISEILIVTREDLIPTVGELCREEKKVTACIPGGRSRSESVLRGLEAAGTELVAIHDGARPFVTREIIDCTVAAAEEYGGAAPAVPVKDTIKVADKGRVTGTPDRATLFAVQTPQVFEREAIGKALAYAMEKGIPLTDDCSAAETAGMAVVLTEGSEENIKITTPLDLIIGEKILERRAAL